MSQLDHLARYALAWKSASSRAHGTWFTCAIASTDGAASGYRLWRSTTHGGHATTAFSTSHASTDACHLDHSMIQGQKSV